MTRSITFCHVLLYFFTIASGALQGLDSLEDVPQELQNLWDTQCDRILERYKDVPPVSQSPPKEMPEDTISMFTMDGKVEVGKMFVDDTIGGQGTHYKYPLTMVEDMITSAKKLLEVPVQDLPFRRIPKMDQWLLAALKEHPVDGKNVVVFGSMQPWYEAIVLAAGAHSVHTMEYNNVSYDHPQITTSIPSTYNWELEGFDIALSISSFDHDGLGRYGDPVNPIGDLLAMRIANCMLKSNGLLFLTVPVGPDVVVWNLHRRYGSFRLPLLLYGWRHMGSFGWEESKLTQKVDWRRSYEPVHVLQRVGARDEL
eukprot:m.26000 g.26000  ORF g.26000 m.26000 type:complete len:312 (+) comp7758_c0_seq1:237-1172(+)